MSGIACHEKQPLQWDSHELASWLSSRGLPPDVTETFKQRYVFGMHAANLHDDDLVQLGIRHPIRRRRVIRELQQLFHGHSFASASVSDVSQLAGEPAELPDLRSHPLRGATNAPCERKVGWHNSVLEVHEWSSAGPVFTGQEIYAVEAGPEASLEDVGDESTGTVASYEAMKQLSASKASLSRKCMKLRQELFEERRRRSITTSDQERRVHEAIRVRNGMQCNLRNAVRRSKSKERENVQLQARLKEMLPDEDSPDANTKAEPAEPWSLLSPRWKNKVVAEATQQKEATHQKEEVCSEEPSQKQRVGAMGSRGRQASRWFSGQTIRKALETQETLEESEGVALVLPKAAA